jgi:raffinose/stachyose/melibiose transport system substrate-binding protein
LLNITEYVNASYDNTGGQPFRSVVNADLMDMAFEKGNGSFTIVPYQPFIFTTMYNKDLFTAAGITSPPKTWAEFQDACAKLLASGVTPITVDNAYIPALMGYTLSRIVGAAKCDDMVSNLDFSDPGVLRAAQIWEDMVANGYISTKAATNVYPEGQASEFATGSVAMYLNGTWLPNELRELNPDINWGSFAWPAIDATGDGIESNNIGAQSYGINKNTEYPKAAFAFVRWMTVGEWDQKLANESWGVPMANAAQWPSQTVEAKAVFDATTNPFVWAASMENDPNVTATLIDGFQRLVSGSMTAEDYAASLAALGN